MAVNYYGHFLLTNLLLGLLKVIEVDFNFQFILSIIYTLGLPIKNYQCIVSIPFIRAY